MAGVLQEAAGALLSPGVPFLLSFALGWALRTWLVGRHTTAGGAGWIIKYNLGKKQLEKKGRLLQSKPRPLERTVWLNSGWSFQEFLLM